MSDSDDDHNFPSKAKLSVGVYEPKVMLTKTNKPDKRTETSRANALKARMAKLNKLALKKAEDQKKREEAKRIREESSGSDTSADESAGDSDSEDELDVIPRRKVGRPKKSEEATLAEARLQALQQSRNIENLTDAVRLALKKEELERKAKAKAKRDAIKKAKADGTYVAKGRGRPFLPQNTILRGAATPAKEAVEVKVKENAREQKENAYISW